MRPREDLDQPVPGPEAERGSDLGVHVQVRLFASLRERLPAASRGRGRVALGEGATLLDLLELLAIPPAQAQMVLVNGEQAPRSEAARAGWRLEPGDVVSIFPPLAGG
jgi:molybdopterin converting factor small subunit